MTFQLTDQHTQEYHTLGFTVFRSLVPASLLRDLRLETDKGRQLGRERGGPQIRRIQPVGDYELSLKPFLEFAKLPELTTALQTVLTPEHWYGRKKDDPLAMMGVLYEPAEKPFSTPWHRDWRDNFCGLDVAAWQERSQEIGLFNQVNCALYEDSSLWVVPGSHRRRDLPAEIERFPDRPIRGANYEGCETIEEMERVGLEYCRSMSEGVRTHLDPGDLMLYRNSLWHLGYCSPSRKRATIHDFIGSPDFDGWLESRPMSATPDRWMNPNAAS